MCEHKFHKEPNSYTCWTGASQSILDYLKHIFNIIHLYIRYFFCMQVDNVYLKQRIWWLCLFTFSIFEHFSKHNSRLLSFSIHFHNQRFGNSVKPKFTANITFKIIVQDPHIIILNSDGGS